MELEDLQALVWVDEHGSLHAAAKARGVSRTTLRRRLDRLESAVGAPVAVTHDRGLRLTPMGALVLEHAGDLLSRRDAILERVRGAFDAPEGTVRIVACSGFPPALVASVMAVATRTYPGVAFNVQRTPRPFEQINSTVDLVVTWADHEPPPTGFSRVFHRETFGVVASAAYLRIHGVPRALEELQDHTMLHENGTRMAWPLRAGGQHPIQATHHVDDAYLLGCAAAAGIGLALIPRVGAGLHPSFDALQPVLPEVLGGERGVRFHAPVATRHRGPAAALVEHLERFADLMEPQVVKAP